jgi:hypothetical protein
MSVLTAIFAGWPNSPETRLSIKAFGNWGLSLGECHDFDRAMGRELRTRRSLGFVVEGVAGAGAWLGSWATMVVQPDYGQAAFR